ncbi:polysaccharide deacetylase family protein [Sinanaerobacter sp. ZZT-01]|uniref:polysaccharide deacetylase family protein n=1 Tax=Sinanaerobacter sp. ZZT-01 TaxID=3111540 RepID=UPI002D7965DB|nr:polysaccharide deacetylase family protein [Sinanaerobacter sp. ZZT-01]WRR93115.1 polysaccharide deacetylase family protein [Sinanaerobacter sp. ZZT-01]
MTHADTQIKITKNIVDHLRKKAGTLETINHRVIPVCIPILMFHHISDEENASLTSDTFRRYMIELKEGGYETIFYEDLYGFVNGSNDLPEKPVIVTFDDGYESNYLYAYPILKGLGMKAEISIIGSSVGLDENPSTGLPIIPHFSWEQAKEMINSGYIRIRSHSYELHQHVSAEEVDRLGVIKNSYESPEYYSNMFSQDARLMKQLIKQNLNYDDFVYTYPYGKYNIQTEGLLRNLKYKVTVTTNSGINQVRIGDYDSLRLMKRIPCDTNNSQNIIERIYYYK